MTLRLAVLGDSIAFGVGADRPSDRLAARLVSALSEAGVPAQSQVFAVPGARSQHLPDQVRRTLGWRPELAVMVIGANDLTHLVDATQATRALREALRSLRSTGCEVVVAPAPDLSVVPHVPPALRGLVQAGSSAYRQAQVRVTLAEGGRVADVGEMTSAFFARDPSLFCGDRFHPSSAGYAVIAQALAPVVVEAAAGLRAA